MKTLLAIFYVIFFSVGSASAAQFRHYIFFVHGIGGNAQTFGSMPEAMIHHLDQAKPEAKHETYRFIYPTNDKSLSGDDFAVQLGKFIHANLKDRIQTGDKISLISHSQGGLVSLIWYYYAYTQSQVIPIGPLPLGENMRDKIDYYPEYVPYMDAFISVGTPYWGSKLASILIKDNWLAKFVEESFFKKLGHHQLQEMALGSQTILEFRENITKIPPALLNEMKQKIRPLSIAGSADVVNIFKKKTFGTSSLLRKLKGLVFGSRYYESDIAVPVPSARFDSIYTVDRNENYVSGAVTGIAQTKITEFAPLLILNTIHASPDPKSIPDMVDVPENCIQSLICDHPTFKYLFDHLVGNPVPGFGPGVVKEALGGFMASFRIKFPRNVSAKDQKVQIKLMSPQPTNDFEIKIANTWEIMSKFDYFTPTNPSLLFRSETGHIVYKNYQSDGYRQVRQNGVKATFLIQAKGFRARYVETILKPTFSTFVEVSLAKD